MRVAPPFKHRWYDSKARVTISALLLKSTLPQIKSKCVTDFQGTLFWIHEKQGMETICAEQSSWDAMTHSSELLEPSETYPADLPSRDLELFVKQLWHSGPDWLNTNVVFYDPKSTCTSSSTSIRWLLGIWMETGWLSWRSFTRIFYSSNNFSCQHLVPIHLDVVLARLLKEDLESKCDRC